jgi:hypothetical protein
MACLWAWALAGFALCGPLQLYFMDKALTGGKASFGVPLVTRHSDPTPPSSFPLLSLATVHYIYARPCVHARPCVDGRGSTL